MNQRITNTASFISNTGHACDVARPHVHVLNGDGSLGPIYRRDGADPRMPRRARWLDAGHVASDRTPSPRTGGYNG